MRAVLHWVTDELGDWISMTEDQASFFIRGMALMFVLVIGALIVSTLLYARLFGGGV